MTNTYTVNLINHDGCNFDYGEFTNLKKARSWASGRGYTYDFGQWHPYMVMIAKNGEEFLEYRTH